MNHLVFVDAQVGDLEKILSGIKTMVIKEVDPSRSAAHPVHPGDNLYFLRDKDDLTPRVRATVTRVLLLTSLSDEDVSQTLKEMQPGLQLTEDQYINWSTRQEVMLVEFETAHKIDSAKTLTKKITGSANWIAFEEFNPSTDKQET